jgi:hypothetical protein
MSMQLEPVEPKPWSQVNAQVLFTQVELPLAMDGHA